MTSVAYGIAIPASRGVLGQPTSLLLDRLSAAPTGAFATFKLSSTYAGPCLRAIRHSDGAEQDIGFSGNALDTAGLLTFAGAGDAFVKTHYDQSGNARHLIQATQAKQPKIVSAGNLISTINGLPSILFDGTASNLAGPAISNFLNANAYGAVSLSCPSAGAATDNGYQGRAPIADGSGFWWHSFGPADLIGGHWNNLGGGGEQSARISASYPNVYVAAHSFDGAHVKAWLNGGTAASYATAWPIQTISGSMGEGKSQSNYFVGTLAATILFNTATVLADLNAIGADWASKGGVNWTSAS